MEISPLQTSFTGLPFKLSHSAGHLADGRRAPVSIPNLERPLYSRTKDWVLAHIYNASDAPNRHLGLAKTCL